MLTRGQLPFPTPAIRAGWPGPPATIGPQATVNVLLDRLFSIETLIPGVRTLDARGS